MAKEIEPKLQTIGAYLKKQIFFVFLNIKEHILGIYQIAISCGKISNLI